MSHRHIFEWEGKEHEFDDKPAEWYWALGVVSVASIIASILFGNYLLAVVLLTAAFAIGLQAAKEPGVHQFKLSEDGLMIDHRLYKFSIMHSFSMFEHIDPKQAPILSIKTNSILAPHFLIPLEGINADAMYAFLFAYIDEGEHKETLIDRAVDFLRL